MKKILTVLTLSISALLISNFVSAAPFSDDSKRHEPRDRWSRDDVSDQDIQDRRKSREERGFKRLQEHKWQTGYVMPQHYRGNSYKTEYKDHNLSKPGRNQQWYKVNNDFILVDSDSNSIIKIQEN